MSHPSFDLTREQWIPCETLRGERVELGIQDALVHAHELAGVHDESPLATAMIHRLLLAVLHRVVDGPRSLRAWADVWRQPRFDAEAVRGYLDAWRHRFDLFDSERPFLQVRGLEQILASELGRPPQIIDAARLTLECSSYGSAVDLLEHNATSHAISPARAALAVLAFQGFGPEGRITNDSGHHKQCPLRCGAVAVARGSNLRATLTLNLLIVGDARPIPSEADDAPAWEQAAHAQRETRLVRGWLDALTWQARRAELLPERRDSHILVRSVVTGAGARPASDWIEPMHTLVVRDTKVGPKPLRFDIKRSLWRDATALFEGAGAADAHRRPAVCAQVALLIEEGLLDSQSVLQLDLFGLVADKVAIKLWRAERIPLPARILVDPARLDVVRSALRAAEEAGDALRRGIWRFAQVTLSPGKRAPDAKDVSALVTRLDADASYWAELGMAFVSLIEDVGGAGDPEGALQRWKRLARGAARRAFAEATERIGTSARQYQACALGERVLAREMHTLATARAMQRPTRPTKDEGLRV